MFLQKVLPYGALATGIDEAAKRSRDANMARRRRGCLGGVSDLLVYHNGTLVCLEAKTSSGALGDNQKAFRDGILRNGGHYAVVRTMEDVEAALVDAGIPLRASLGAIRERIAEQNERLPAKPKRVSRKPGAPRGTMSIARYRAAHAKGLI